MTAYLVTRHRGHPIEPRGGAWVYVDTGEPVSDKPDRPCGHCGRANTPEGYDGCIGEIPGAANACCGHGDDEAAYAQGEGGIIVQGPALLSILRTVESCDRCLGSGTDPEDRGADCEDCGGTGVQ